MEFKVGDRVRCEVEAPDYNENIHIGYLGTVGKIDTLSNVPIGVIWDDDVEGHNFNGNSELPCAHGHGWSVKEDDISLVCSFQGFKIGDRVQCIKENAQGNMDLHIGSTGTIAIIYDKGTLQIGVCWDEAIDDGHTLLFNGVEHCQRGYGYWVHKNEVCIINVEEFEPATETELESFLLNGATQ